MRFVAYCLLAVISIGSQAPRVFAQVSTVVQKTLHVQQNDAGKWFGWVMDGNRRKGVVLPQSKEGIQEFADRYQADIEWHIKPPAALGDSTTTESDPATAESADFSTPPSNVVRAGNQSTTMDSAPATATTIAPAIAPERLRRVSNGYSSSTTRRRLKLLPCFCP